MRIIALVGDNWLGVKQELDKQVSEFVKRHGDLAVERIDGSEAELDKIMSAVSSPSLLMPQKMCVIYDLSKNKNSSGRIEQILNLDSETEIILVEGKLDKRSSYYKILKKLDGFKEFEELDEQGTIKWLIEESKSLGASLSRPNAQYLYSRIGGNQSRLKNELKKLADYGELISKDSIDLLTEANPRSSIFDLLNAAFSGNHKKAIKLYDEQRVQKVEPGQILAMLGWQMHVVALVKSAKDMSPAEIAKQASVNPFVIQKSRQIATKLDRQQTKDILAELVDIDYKLKNKNIDGDEAIKNLLVKLAN